MSPTRQSIKFIACFNQKYQKFSYKYKIHVYNLCYQCCAIQIGNINNLLSKLQNKIQIDMLGQNRGTDALLGGNRLNTSDTSARSAPAAAPTNERITVNNEAIQNNESSRMRESIKSEKTGKKRKHKEQQTQFTTVLKFLNIIIGLGVVGFGVSCYFFFNDDVQNLEFVGIILPGYIAFSGLIILLIECNIGFMVRNMKFLYNFIGRGLFNIYVGVMPLSMIRSKDEAQKGGAFQIIIFIMVSLMCLVGALYIIAKIFCCAKQENKRKRRRRSESGSDSDQ